MVRPLIICNGAVDDHAKLYKGLSFAALYDAVITVDGGIAHARRMGLSIDLAIGDFDSIQTDDIQYIQRNGIKKQTYPSDKNKTDSELAVDYCIQSGSSAVTVVAFRGSRLDHTVANILMFSEKSRTLAVTLVDEHNHAFFVHGHHEFDAPLDHYVSIISITPSVTVEESTGLYYKLNNRTLKRGETVGVSNYAVRRKQTITVSDGIALVTVSHD
ncbi:MAG: thiamine diphosphokinase [Spirochaetota bacterium]